MCSKKFNPFKDFQSDQIQRSSLKEFTAHYACRKANLNLTLVAGTTNGFIFQIISSLIESCGVCLTCLDCNCTDSWEGKRHILPDIIVMGRCGWPLEVWSLCSLYVLLMPLIHCIRAFSDNMATHKYVTWKLHAKTYLLKRRCVRTSSQKRATVVWFSQVTTTHEQPLIFAFFVVPSGWQYSVFFSYHPREETSPPVISKTSW